MSLLSTTLSSRFETRAGNEILMDQIYIDSFRRVEFIAVVTR